MSHAPIVGPMPQSPAWHAMRRYDPSRTERPVVIGASEAAAACGRSPYSSPLELYLTKRGEYELEHSDETAEAMEMGLHLEPLILDRYTKRTGHQIERSLPMFFAALQPWMAATPDAMVLGDGAWSRSVDAKATSGRRYDRTGDDISAFGAEGTDQIPIDYLLQGQQQCHVMGVELVDFPVLFDARTLRIYTVRRDAELISEMIAAERELCERIINADPPEPTWSHSGIDKIIRAMNGSTSGKIITWGPSESALLEEDKRLAAVESETKKRRETIKARLWDALGDAEEAHTDTQRVKRVIVQPYEYIAKNPGYSKLQVAKLK